MPTTPTQLPVPSGEPQDFKFNIGKIDQFVTSFAEWYVDRFGDKHYTIEGLKQLALQQIYNLGWNLAGTFQWGAVVSSAGDIIQDTTTGIWYRWDDLGSLPKTVPPDSTPSSSGGTGDGKWQPVEITDVLRKDLAKSSGAGLSGFNPFSSYPANTVGNHLAQVPGSDNTGVNNSLDSFNAAILKLALAGGGILHPEPGVYLISGGSVLLPSYITLDLRGCELKGDGTNTLIASGAIVGGALIDITPEYGTGGGDGNGTHFVIHGKLLGGRLTNAGCGIRGQRLNYGSSIEEVWFDETLTESWRTTHSWGLKVSHNTSRAPAFMLDFVDWTEVSNNDFEGRAWSYSGYIALTIGTGGHGGSYSCRVISNGFHQMETAINLVGEIDDLVIESNHFERTVYHVTGDQYTKRNFLIKQNWMKANLDGNSSKPGVVSMSFSSLIDSDIGPNRFTNDSGATYDAHIVANGDECYGNRYYVGYKLDSDNDFSKIKMSNANILYVIRGSNYSDVAQPSAELRSGSSAYTVEKYKSVYNMQDNKIPFCDVYLDGHGNATITTWFSQSDQLLCAFSFRFISATSTAVVAGTFCYDASNITINKLSSGGSLGMAIGSAGDGRQILSFSQVPTGATVRGWVKQL